MQEARAARLGRNQAVVRSLNAQLDGGLITPSAPFAADVTGFLCECSDLDCTELIYVSLSKYAEIRADRRRFLVRPGHQLPEIEAVVERDDDYLVVQKVGAAARALAEGGGPHAGGGRPQPRR